MGEETKSNIFVARQPIFLRSQKVYAYELLFRSGLENFFDPAQDGEQATSKVITSTFLLIGLPKLTGGKKAFINFTEEMLLKGYATLFPRKETVVEVLESVAASPAVAKACEGLARKNYVLALDDFLYEERFIPLLKLARIVKFDIRQMSLAELSRQVRIVKEYNVKLLAEKIETIDEFAVCKKLGFDLFQGYFFSRPKVVEGHDIPGSKLQYLRMLRLVQDENYDFEKLAELISRDVSLAYKLLKYVNSAYFARMREVSSLQEAVAMLGEINLRKWLSLMMLSYMADDKPSELLRLATLRGAFCELVAARLLGKAADAGKYHTVGIFSLLPAMLDKPMAEIVGELSLPAEIKDALLGGQEGSLLGGVLSLAEAYERGEWEPVSALAASLGISNEELPWLYESALDSLQGFDFPD